jgi:hypothetical protein
MDLLTFISKIIGALAWPVSIFFALWLFRRQIGQLLPQIRRLKYKDFEAEFGETVRKLKAKAIPLLLPVQARGVLPSPSERLEHLVEISPSAAVQEAWKEIESAAKALIERRGYKLDYDIQTPFRLIERVLEKTELIDSRKLRIFHELRQLRNKVAHAEDFEVSEDQAYEYIQLAMILINYLNETDKK